MFTFALLITFAAFGLLTLAGVGRSHDEPSDAEHRLAFHARQARGGRVLPYLPRR